MGLEVTHLGPRKVEHRGPKNRVGDSKVALEDKILALERENELLRAAASAEKRVARNVEEEPPIKGLATEAVKSGELIGRDWKEAAVAEEERARSAKNEVSKVEARPDLLDESGRSEDQAALRDAVERRA